MNTEERHAVRMALKGLGFERTGYTDDFAGTGEYAETWERTDDPNDVGNVVRIEWAKRDPAPSAVDDRCPYVSTDPSWETYRKRRDDGLRCGKTAGHANEHTLYSADGERILANDGWALP